MLQKLEIRALRGATQKFCLDFESGKTITIVYGENGSGKSTICDAVELLANGKLSSLDGKGLGKTESFWHSTGYQPSDVAVTLTTSKGEWTAKIVRSKVTVTPATDRPRAAVLRRNQILGLIAQQPKNRFDAIRPFLDIETVEQSEASLKKLIEQEQTNSRTAIARIDENRVAVENFWQEAGSPGTSALSWARQELLKDTKDLELEVSRLEAFIGAAEGLVAEQVRLAESLQEQEPATDGLVQAQAKVKEEQARVASTAGELVEVLTAANSYFHEHTDPDACPLCGSPQYATGLPERVQVQLDSISALTQALAQRGSAERKLTSTRTLVERQQKAFLAAAVRLAQVVSTDAPLPATDYPSSLVASASQYLACPEAERPSAGHALGDQASRFVSIVKAARDERRKQFGFAQTLRRAVDTYDTNYRAQAELERLIPRLEAALNEMQAERRKFVDDVLKKVADRVGELYEEIHPGEGLSKISLALDPDKRASLDILGQFPATAEAPPGAYFSESHLDTLGLCIWLALAEMDDPRNTILVLDDVIASVDEPHVERVVELLYNLAQNFQHCVYTTHYRPWREKYRWGWLQNGECHFVDLVPWRHDAGIQQGRSVPPIEELRNLLAAQYPSAQMACASAGVMLEAILDFLTLQYECAVPRRKGKLTLGDLLPCVSKKLRAALRVEQQEIAPDGTTSYVSHDLGLLFDELSAIAQARNVFGAHFNDLAFSLPERDALRFAQCVLVLADHLIDVQCGWPGSPKSGSYWANSKQTRRLHPLKQPG